MNNMLIDVRRIKAWLWYPGFAAVPSTFQAPRQGMLQAAVLFYILSVWSAEPIAQFWFGFQHPASCRWTSARACTTCGGSSRRLATRRTPRRGTLRTAAPPAAAAAARVLVRALTASRSLAVPVIAMRQRHIYDVCSTHISGRLSGHSNVSATNVTTCHSSTAPCLSVA